MSSSSNSVPLGVSYWRYWTGFTISALGDWLAVIALSFALVSSGGGIGALGVALLARQLAISVVVLIGGVLADRFLPSHVISASQVARAGCQIGVAVLLATDPRQWPVLVALQLVSGAASAFARPAQSALIRRICPPEALQRATSLLGISNSMVSLLGAAIGAGILAVANASDALLIDAASFLVALVLMWRLGAKSSSVGVARGAVLVDLAEGLKEARSVSWFFPLVSVFALSQLLYNPSIAVLGPSIALKYFGGAGFWALVLGVVAVGGVIGGLVSVRLAIRRRLLMAVVLTTGAGLELIVLAGRAPLPVILVSSLVSGIGIAMSNVLWFTTLQSEIRSDMVGRLSSIDWLGSLALAPVGLAIIPIVAQKFGPLATMGMSGAVLIAGCALVALIPSVRRTGAPSLNQMGPGFES